MNKTYKILIAPDSFKGSLSAVEISGIISQKLLDSCLPIRFSSIPLADGGEGSLEAINQSLEFELIKYKVLNPQFKEVEAMYLYDKQSYTAYIELAQASGLCMVDGKNDIIHASTYGTGQLIKHAIENGALKIVLFLGGSATCDAGLGIADALGIVFYNSNHQKIAATADNLYKISCFDDSSSILKGKTIDIMLAVDVNNPFYGINGASFVYSPQKGANRQQVKQLDDGLLNIANMIKEQVGTDLQQIPGSGAAGGTAGGMIAFAGAKIEKGTDFIFNLIRLEEQIMQADLVISGEGKIDSQSLNNKLLFGISRITAKYDKKLWAICGFFEGDNSLKEALFLEKVFSLAHTKEEMADSIRDGKEKLKKTLDDIISSITELVGK